MEPIYVGALSLLPPLIAIALALITKEVISSLLMGILSGTLIYSIASGLNPVVGTVDTAFRVMTTKIDVNIILFLALLGALVAVMAKADGTRAYGQWAARKLRSKRSSLLATAALGAVIFIDDYFNCLTVGTVMKPVSDKHKVSREKLAYVIDATAAPICIIAPISSWAVAVGSNLQVTGIFDSTLSAFVATIPYNLYALMSIILVIFVCVTGWDFGPMRTAEERAEKGILNTTPDDAPVQPDPDAKNRGTVLDMVIPVLSLIIFSVLAMLDNGGYWGDDPAYHSIAAAFGNCTASEALVISSFGALIVAFIMYLPRRVVTFRGFMDAVTDGVKSMVPANLVLVLAWTISGVCRELLSTGEYVQDLVVTSGIPVGLLPCMIFIVAAFLSFATGTAWGTFSILIPIVVPLMSEASPTLLIVSLSAVLAGSVFGDHCSPISDTTILSSTGAGVPHIAHVSTQACYSILVAVCCALGYLAGGLAGGNLLIMWLVALPCMLGAVCVLHLHRKPAEQ